MNKNSENYKNTFSRIRPSDNAVERIMDMTKGKNKGLNVNFKKIAAVVMALVLFVSGGIGINYAVQKNNSNEFGVLVAYASTGEYYKIGAQSKQDLFYALYILPEDDKEKAKQVYAKYQQDDNRLRDEIEKFAKDGYMTSFGGVNIPCYNKEDKGKETAYLRSIEGGILALNFDDYKDVKTFQVENTSEYGYIIFENLAQYEKLVEIAKYDNDDLTDEETRSLYGIGHKFKISGDELRRSQKDGFYYSGIKSPVSKGYNLRWYPSDELCDAVGNNPSFDLTQIKDTITFTVEFNDGTVKTASANLYFDKDGNMNFE